jgi:hypothetical protein
VLVRDHGRVRRFPSLGQPRAASPPPRSTTFGYTSEHLLFADYDQELDCSEIYLDVWVQLKIDGEPQQWTPLSLTQRYVYLNDKTEYQMGWRCTENYTRLYPPGSGNQLRFAVFAVENGQYNPVYDCNDEWYMDPTTLDATEQWTEWLEAGQSQTLTFHYDTTEGR